MKTIKERALELLRQFPLQYLAPVKLHEVCNELESVLKTLAYAPEPEPVAHAVILPNGMTRIWFSDRDSGELWRARERVEQELTPLYTAPPAPSVPDADLVRDAEKWRMLPAFLEEFQIPYLQLEGKIDAAIAEVKGQA